MLARAGCTRVDPWSVWWERHPQAVLAAADIAPARIAWVPEFEVLVINAQATAADLTRGLVETFPDLPRPGWI